MSSSLNSLRDFFPGVTPLNAPRLGLVMIIKNDQYSDEAHCVLNCLNSVRPIITSVCAVFTAKDDRKRGQADTVIRQWCEARRVPFHASYLVWHDDFSEARNAALALADEKAEADWYLLPDCDEVLFAVDTARQILMQLPLQQDACFIPLLMNGGLTTRTNLIRKLPRRWRYVGRTDEDLELDEGRGGKLPVLLLGNPTDPGNGPYFTTNGEGARSRDPQKAQKDIENLRKEWLETGRPRSLYFMAIRLFASLQWSPAIAAFQQFLALKDTEPWMRYWSLVCLGRAYLAQQQYAEALPSLRAAIELVPTRPEALGELGIALGNLGRWDEARIYACAATYSPQPKLIEYFEPHWGLWQALDLLTVSLINMGEYGAALPYLEWLLKSKHLPQSEAGRVRSHYENIKAALTPAINVPQQSDSLSAARKVLEDLKAKREGL